MNLLSDSIKSIISVYDVPLACRMTLKKLAHVNIVILFSLLSSNKVWAQIEYFAGVSEKYNSNIAKSVIDDSGTESAVSIGAKGQKVQNKLDFGIDGALSHVQRNGSIIQNSSDSLLNGSTYVNVNFIPQTFSWLTTLNASTVQRDLGTPANPDNLSNLLSFTTQPQYRWNFSPVNAFVVKGLYGYADLDQAQPNMDWVSAEAALEHKIEQGLLSLVYQDEKREFDANIPGISKSNAYIAASKRWRLLDLNAEYGRVSVEREGSSISHDSSRYKLLGVVTVGQTSRVSASAERNYSDRLSEMTLSSAFFKTDLLGGQNQSPLSSGSYLNPYFSDLMKTDNYSFAYATFFSTNTLELNYQRVNRDALNTVSLVGDSDETVTGLRFARMLSQLSNIQFSYHDRSITFNAGLEQNIDLFSISYNKKLSRHVDFVGTASREQGQFSLSDIRYDDNAVFLSLRYVGIL